MRKEIPLLYSTIMVQSLLAKRKHMTRREIKKKYSNTDIVWRDDKNGKRLVERQNDVPDPVTTAKEDGTTSTTHHLVGYREIKCPYGKPGDILYVREIHYRYGRWVKDGLSKNGKQKWSFQPDDKITDIRFFDNRPDYVYRNSHRLLGWYKRNSLFMPKSAARIFLLNEGVKVERLHDISEIDAISEGVEPVPDNGFKSYEFEGAAFYGDCKATRSFRTLWEKINGVESWKANPYVWVISFKILSTTGKPESLQSPAPAAAKN